MSVESQELATFEEGKQALQILIADTADSDGQLCSDLITAFEQPGIKLINYTSKISLKFLFSRRSLLDLLSAIVPYNYYPY